MGIIGQKVSIDDVERALQWELADLSIEYDARAPHSPYSSAEFANREADIGRQFAEIGRTPSYPPNWTGAARQES